MFFKRGEFMMYSVQQNNCKNLNNEEIISQINMLRSALIETGMKEGLQSDKTLEISQLLDRCLNQYQTSIHVWK
jgi:hypothetical protein